MDVISRYVKGSTGRLIDAAKIPRQSYHKYVSLSVQNQTSTSILTDTADTVQFKINKASIGFIKQIFLTVGVSVASAGVQLAPA